MPKPHTDRTFDAEIPLHYERHLVPLIFQTYADDLAKRVAAKGSNRVLEIAAGTGVATRAMAERLPGHAEIVATDLNQPMLDQAEALGAKRPVEWRQADAMALPFGDASFDAVACQFGVMFLPDKAAGFREMRRVLRPGGTLLFNVWDRLEDNEFADAVTSAVHKIYPDSAPSFLARTPHGYFDQATIAKDLADAGFTGKPRFEVVSSRSRIASAQQLAHAFCLGCPLKYEIEARDPSRVEATIEMIGAAVAMRFGHTDLDGKTQAIIVTTEA